MLAKLKTIEISADVIEFSIDCHLGMLFTIKDEKLTFTIGKITNSINLSDAVIEVYNSMLSVNDYSYFKDIVGHYNKTTDKNTYLEYLGANLPTGVLAVDITISIPVDHVNDFIHKSLEQSNIYFGDLQKELESRLNKL